MKREGWNAETLEAADWLATWTPPGELFFLWPWVLVGDPEQYVRVLRQEAQLEQIGIGRDTWGAVGADVRRLYELFGRDDNGEQRDRRGARDTGLQHHDD